VQQFASSRIRVYYPHVTLLESGVHGSVVGLAPDADVLVIQKSLDSNVLEFARREFRGRPVVWDFDDAFYSHPRFPEMMELAQLVTTDTAARADQFAARGIGPACVVWPDCIDYDPAAPMKPVERARGVVWFGNHTNLASVECELRRLCALDEQVAVITQPQETAFLKSAGIEVIPWTLAGFTASLRRFRVAVLSHRGGDANVKSNNKLIAAVTLGVPCVVWDSNSYSTVLHEFGLARYVVRSTEELIAAVSQLCDLRATHEYLDHAQTAIWERFNRRTVTNRFLSLVREQLGVT
jgi:hypothetical protein